MITVESDGKFLPNASVILNGMLDHRIDGIRRTLEIERDCLVLGDCPMPALMLVKGNSGRADRVVYVELTLFR